MRPEVSKMSTDDTMPIRAISRIKVAFYMLRDLLLLMEPLDSLGSHGYLGLKRSPSIQSIPLPVLVLHSTLSHFRVMS